MRRNHRLVFIPFLIAGAVVLSFLSSRAYLTHYLSRLSQTSLALVSTTIPALEPLTHMRLELHRIVSFGHSEPGARTALARANVVRGALTRLNQGFRDYALLPRSPRSHLLEASVAAKLQALNQLCELALADAAQSRSGEPSTASLDALRTATEAFTVAVTDELAMTVREANEAHRSLVEARAAAVPVRRMLDLICVVTAALGALLATWLIHRHLDLVARYAELQEEKVRELDLFSGRVAHDILGPLQPVALSLELLKRRSPPQDLQAPLILQRAHRGIERVRLIVHGLLIFARSGARPGAQDRSSLSAVLDGVAGDLLPAAQRAGVELRIEPAAIPAELACAEAAVTVVLENLVLNAIKYLGDRPVRRVTARSEIGEAWIRLSIEDTGPGVPPGLEASVFDPYVRAAGLKQEGIGLGLATVKRIAEAHGGTVGVCSLPGQGATFWVDLPRAASNSACHPTSHRAKQSLSKQLFAAPVR